MSIRVRFILVICCIALLAISAFAFLSYTFTVNTAMEEAKEKGAIVSTFLESSLKFYKQQQRPLIIDNVDVIKFHPYLMSGFAVSRGIWSEFENLHPGYVFKQASLDPRYPPNRADKDERRLLVQLNMAKDGGKKEGVIEKNGEKFFYYAKPIKVKEGCLRCHGDPAKAPRNQVALYGTKNGYNWKTGEVVAGFFTYVPVQRAMDDAMKSAVVLLGYGVAGILVLTLVIWVFFEKRIIRPIKGLESRATEISLGKGLDDPISMVSKDEIGALGKAVERMRVSVLKLIERGKQN